MLGTDPLARCHDGLAPSALHRLRSLIAERGRNSWDVGDLLVEIFGPPARRGHDGSGARIATLAEEVGASASWLAACRTTAAAWPRVVRRPTVAWSVSRHLASHPDRIALLDAFVRDCERDRRTPSLATLVDWLDAQGRIPLLGRPRGDPYQRVERLALALDPADLARLVDRLTAALSVAA